MSRRKRSDAEIIAESLTHLDAVCMRLSAAIEALNQGDPLLGRRLFDGAWDDMWATRNHIAHAYFLIDDSIIADTVKNDLPEFERVLREISNQSQ